MRELSMNETSLVAGGIWDPWNGFGDDTVTNDNGVPMTSDPVGTGPGGSPIVSNTLTDGGWVDWDGDGTSDEYLSAGFTFIGEDSDGDGVAENAERVSQGEQTGV